MGWVIRDPRIIWWGGRGVFLDPRGSMLRGPPTTHCSINPSTVWASSKHSSLKLFALTQ